MSDGYEPGEEDYRKLADLAGKVYAAEDLWLRQILTLAAGALALLAGLGPDVPSEGPARYLLAATWACLGLGIIVGAGATYVNVHRARRYAMQYGKMLKLTLKTGEPPPQLIPLEMNRLLLLSKPMAMVILLAAVLCLTGYSIAVTLSSQSCMEQTRTPRE